MKRPVQTSDPARLEHEAAEWVIRRDRGFSPAEQDAFSQWLASDPRCGEAYARQDQSWRNFDLLADWRPEHSVEPNADLLAGDRPARRWRRGAGWGLLAAACLTVLVVWQDQRPAARTPLAPPAVDRYERRALADGSTVELNRGAQLDVQYSATERRLQLYAGEAYFSVARNPYRPFVVQAGGHQVRAIGTAFQVAVMADAVAVLVTEGVVELQSESATEPAVRVAAGHRAEWHVGEEGGWTVAAIASAEVAQALAWQPQLLDFSSTPLADVVAEFNRHNRVQLVVADPELARLPIVASFRADSVEAFVRLLEITADVQAERRSGEIVLRRRTL